jgi:hypothetical protein
MPGRSQEQHEGWINKRKRQKKKKSAKRKNKKRRPKKPAERKSEKRKNAGGRLRAKKSGRIKRNVAKP